MMETSIPDFDAMSDDELARWVDAEGSYGMTEKQVKRATRAFRALVDRARGFEVLQPNRVLSKSDKLRSIDIRSIHVLPGRRALNENAVVKLMESIERIGLQSPPAVRIVDEVVVDGVRERGVPILIVGHHRLEAMRRLGHFSVTCIVLNIDEVDAELTEISENLHRAELTALQRDELIARWIELTTVKSELPDSESKPAQVAQVSGGRGNKGGLSDAARELGIERTAAQRSVKVAALSSEAKAAAKEVGLDDNRSALLAATKETEPEKQVVVLRDWKRKPAVAERKRDEAECKRLHQNVLDAVVAAVAPDPDAEADPEPVDEPDAEVDADGYYLKDEPVDQWRRSVMNMAGHHISMPAFWTREFGEWTDFAPTAEMVQLVFDAALTWSNLAVDLKRRLAGNDQQQAA